MITDARFRASRIAVLPASIMLARARRLDAEVYLTPGFLYRYQIESLTHTVTVGALARVWQPDRLKAVQVDQKYGVPFITATQVFDIRPRPRKWLAPLLTPDLESLFPAPGTILVTRSGTVGDALMVYSAHKGVAVSDDLLRVEPSEKTLAGYLYTYFRTRYGLALMQSSKYGNVIKHMEPEHLETMPVPLFENELRDDLLADVEQVFRWREEALALELSAEDDYARAVGITADGSLDEPASIPASELFARSRRFDAYHYNVRARGIERAIEHGVPLKELVDRLILPPRFTRGPLVEDGIPFVGSEDIFKINAPVTKFLAPSALANPDRYLVEAGWILIARSGQIYGTNGNVTLADDWHTGKVVSDHVIRVVPSKDVRCGYVKTALGHPTLGEPLILRNAFGTSIPEIAPDDLGTVPVPRLSDALEAEIAEKVEVASSMRDKARKREDAAVAKLEKRIDRALAVEGAEGGPVKVNLPFDEAIGRALRVPPPEGGWAAEERAAKKRRKRA